MKPIELIAKSLNKDFERDNLRRNQPIINRIDSRFANMDDSKIILFSTNDYLGLLSTSTSSFEDSPVFAGSGGSRYISGTSKAHVELESRLSDILQTDKSIILNSGYLANLAAISTLVKFTEPTVFSEISNHASIIEGIKKHKCKTVIFTHDDLDGLKEEINKDKNPNKILIIESIESISGQMMPLSDLSDICKRESITLVVDEVNSFGLYGDGKGLVHQLGLSQKVDLIVGTFGKAIGCFGGFLSGNQELLTLIQDRAKEYIFTTALPPSLIQKSSDNINFILQSKSLLSDYWDLLSEFERRLSAEDFYSSKDTCTHIFNIKIGDEKTCKLVGIELLDEYNIYATPLVYPTVKRNAACLRVTVTPQHTISDIVYFIESIKKILRCGNL